MNKYINTKDLAGLIFTSLQITCPLVQDFPVVGTEKAIRTPQDWMFLPFTVYRASACVSTGKGYEMWQVKHALLWSVSHALSPSTAPTHSPPCLSPSLVSYSTLTGVGGGSHACNSAENWTVDHLTSSIPAAHLSGKHRERFSANRWFDVTSHTLISSHIRRRLSGQSRAITCVCVTLIYSLSAGSSPFIWVNLAGLHSGITPHCCCDVNLQLMEGFISSVQQLADHSSSNFSWSLQGLPQRLNSLPVSLSSDSSSLAPSYFMYSLMTSINLHFGLPRGLLSDSSSLGILPPMACWSI